VAGGTIEIILKEPFVTVLGGQEHRNYGIVKPRKSQWNFLEFVVDISAS
jgi:hypothetical protein